MLLTRAADIAEINPKGLLSAVVSEDGIRSVQHFGMHYIGQMTHMGESEQVWGAQFP